MLAIYHKSNPVHNMLNIFTIPQRPLFQGSSEWNSISNTIPQCYRLAFLLVQSENITFRLFKMKMWDIGRKVIKLCQGYFFSEIFSEYPRIWQIFSHNFGNWQHQPEKYSDSIFSKYDTLGVEVASLIQRHVLEYIDDETMKPIHHFIFITRPPSLQLNLYHRWPLLIRSIIASSVGQVASALTLLVLLSPTQVCRSISISAGPTINYRFRGLIPCDSDRWALWKSQRVHFDLTRLKVVVCGWGEFIERWRFLYDLS